MTPAQDTADTLTFAESGFGAVDAGVGAGTGAGTGVVAGMGAVNAVPLLAEDLLKLAGEQF